MAIIKAKPIDPNEEVIKGNLLKKNWYGNQQLRFFVLYKSGKLIYYKDLTEQKGCLVLGPNCNVRKIGKNEIVFYDEEKTKPYHLLPPTPTDINLAEEKAKGHNNDIDDWKTKILEVIEIVKE